MTQSEIYKYSDQLQSIIDKLEGLKAEVDLASEIIGETETLSDPPVLDLDDGDVSDWHDSLYELQQEIEGLMNTLSVHL